MNEEAFRAFVLRFDKIQQAITDDAAHLRERLDQSHEDSVSQLSLATLTSYVAGRQEKRFKDLRAAADAFLKEAVAVDEKIEDLDGYAVSHYARRTWKEKDWLNWCARPESGFRDLYQAHVELEKAKEHHRKENPHDFYEVGTSIKITPLEVKL